MTRALTSLLHPDHTPRVLVVGDLILDRYIYGSTRRVSPEAPIVVLAAEDEQERLGGCGNVAANLGALGASVEMVSVIGDDEGAPIARRLLEEAGVAVGGLVTDVARPTIRKTRLVAQNQQLLRVDRERAAPLGEEAEREALARLDERLADVDVVVLSDYGKGLLTDRVLARVCAEDRPARPLVLVDPKGRDYARYRGADLITPNKLEAETATGRELGDRESLRAAAEDLVSMAALRLGALITLGARGMYCRLADGATEHEVPARARAVFDVTGAGDTVIAVLAYVLGSGGTVEDAMRLANAAAGVAVQRFGAAVITPAEIERALGQASDAGGKVVDRDELLERLRSARRAGRRIVFTNGCFDVLHVGHLHVLEQARAHGELLVVGVNDDQSVRRLKGDGRPLNTLVDRMTLLAGLDCVGLVTPFSEDTPEQLVEAVTPDVLVKGADYEGREVVGRAWVERHGGHVVLVPLREGHSTTGLLERAARRS